jgi:DNA ligase (NAD+)
MDRKNLEMNLEDLEFIIKEAQNSYYKKSSSAISDEAYDYYWDMLKKNHPESKLLKNVGNDLTEGFVKKEHKMLMGSQEKINTEEGLHSWLTKKKIKYPVVVQYKLDGISIELQYTKGKLTNAITRGDGYKGDDITTNVRKMAGVPTTVSEDFSGSVRGEIIMTNSVFERRYSDRFANPRNLASGFAKSKEGGGCEDLNVVCYDARPEDGFFTHQQHIEKFLIRNYFLITHSYLCFTEKEILSLRESLKEKNYIFAFDGLVLKQDEIFLDDLTRLRPEYQRAFKWKDEGKATIITGIAWNRSGVTYTPVAELFPLELEGSTVSRASLANPNLIKTLEIALNDEVLVTKRGQIIPKIEKVLERPINREEIIIPEFCELCGSKLVNEGTRLFCDNPLCEGRQFHRIQKWFGTLELKGFGQALQETLFSNGIREIPQLYDKEIQAKVLDSTNLKGATIKAFKELNTKKEISLDQLISGFDIEGIGRRIMQEVISDSRFNTLDKLFEAKWEDFMSLNGFAEERAQRLERGLLSLRDTIIGVSNLLSIKESGKSSETSEGVLGSFCITGKLEKGTRKEFIKMIESKGGKFVSGVNKNTDYLIINDKFSNSSKAKKARELGIKMISEDEFFIFF